MNDEFKKIIDKDIARCEGVLSGRVNAYALYQELLSKYSPVITDFDRRLFGIYGEQDYLPNILIMKSKLELFKSMGYQNAFDFNNTQMVINNNNTNSNVIDINISFEQARKDIENMTALPDLEVEEILAKVDELEKIVQSKDRKTKKWDSAKEIIKWIADKGVDVGIALLPLLLQIK